MAAKNLAKSHLCRIDFTSLSSYRQASSIALLDQDASDIFLGPAFRVAIYDLRSLFLLSQNLPSKVVSR